MCLFLFIVFRSADIGFAVSSIYPMWKHIKFNPLLLFGPRIGTYSPFYLRHRSFIQQIFLQLVSLCNHILTNQKSFSYHHPGGGKWEYVCIRKKPTIVLPWSGLSPAPAPQDEEEGSIWLLSLIYTLSSTLTPVDQVLLGKPLWLPLT